MSENENIEKLIKEKKYLEGKIKKQIEEYSYLQSIENIKIVDFLREIKQLNDKGKEFILRILKLIDLYDNVNEIEFSPFNIICTQKKGINNYNFIVNYPDTISLKTIRGIDYRFTKEDILIIIGGIKYDSNR